MATFSNMNISTRLTGLVAGMCMLVACAIGLGFYQAQSISKAYQAVCRDDISAAAVGAAAGMHFNQARAVVLRAVMRQNHSDRQQDMVRLQELDAQVDQELGQLAAKAVSEEGRRTMQALNEQVADYRSLRAAMLGLSPNGLIDSLAFDQAQKAGKAVSARIDEIYGMASSASDKNTGAIIGRIDRNIILVGSFAAAAVVLALVLGLSIAGKLIRRIKLLGDAAERIADGDLSTPLQSTIHDELGHVGDSFEKMRRKVNVAMQEIHVSADQIAAGAKNVSSGSVALSQGAAEQASSVEELSASIAEIASQTKSNAENADRADDRSQEACNNAAEGNADMREMLSAMEGIKNSSEHISKIIKVIDEIAFQTNILALNAAVEAARAGQHGKGFAVVAEEVRNLAARSAEAARETTGMIEDAIAKVNGGRDIAAKTADALQVIVNHVTEVTDIVGAIAKASKEQSLALDQINQGVLQVSQVVQANSATAEESAASSEELSAQADMLRQTAGKFKLQVSKTTANKL